MKAVLGLEDGDYVIGEGFGIEGECSGEICFQYADERVYGSSQRSE